MTQIDAVYRHGVFEPLQPVALREEQRVQISIIESAADQTAQSWLNQVQELHAAIVLRNGVLPDSASDIAADRKR